MESLAQEMVQQINQMVSKCSVDMKILTKSDEKIEMLRNQINEKDALIASLQNKLIELEADSVKKQQLLSNELSKEKLRNQEIIYNMSLKNSEMIHEIQD